MNRSQGLQETSHALQSSVAPALHERGTVLVVEDEDFVREVICELLECEGYRVLRARNAAEAKTVFDRNKHGLRLLLTDVVLPDKNGCDLAQSLRALSPELLVILISGYFENPATRKLVRENRTFYLQKPFSAELLLQKVSQVLLGPEDVLTTARDKLQPV